MAWLWCRKSLEGHELAAGLCPPMKGKLSVNPAVNGYLFELGKDKAGKREGWAPPVICCTQDTVGPLPPLHLWLLGYKKVLPL